jgi:hypothetical protein
MSDKKIKVYDLGHARAGDKGNTSNVSVTAYDERAWNILRSQLTAERVLQVYSEIAKGPETRWAVVSPCHWHRTCTVRVCRF